MACGFHLLSSSDEISKAEQGKYRVKDLSSTRKERPIHEFDGEICAYNERSAGDRLYWISPKSADTHPRRGR